MGSAGQVFGKYEVARQLGAGGMGEILLARQIGLPGLDRVVVLKKILGHLALDPGFLERFLDEMRVASALSHGNIVQVYEVGEVDGEYFMAMEYVEGLDLRELLARLRVDDKRIPVPLALYSLVEVAKALAYAHTRCDSAGRPLSIVHRDVSPANILLSFDGQVKLTDFGVAKASQRMSLTLPGTLHGKVFYMSPEQAAGADCDARSDVFSLGVVAYEMLAGRRPFDGESDLQVLDKVRKCEPAPLASVASWLPPSLCSVVSRAIAARPRDRHEGAEAFGQALTSYMMEAHSVASAKAMSDYLAGFREERPALPPRPRRSLDDIAVGALGASLPAPEAGAGGGTVSVALPAAPHDAPARVGQDRGERRRTVFWALTVGLGAAALLAGFWAMGELAGTVEERQRLAVAPVDQDLGLPEDVPRVPADALAVVDSPPPDTGARDPGPVQPESNGKAAEPSARGSTMLRSTPKGAEVYSGTRRLGVTPVEVSLPRNGTIRLDLKMDGFAEKSVAIGPDSPAAVHAALAKLATGRVRFRYFPADATVILDDRALHPAANLVDMALPEGSHVLVIKSGEESRAVRFKVKEGELTELGTIEPGQ